jgi:hypothetical protein
MLHGAGIVLVIVLLVILFAAASGRVESPVVGRLGDVIYWATSFVAALLALLAAAVALLNTGPDGPILATMLARRSGVPVCARRTMICETCHGRGYVLARGQRIPCGNCGGSGFESCCDGACGGADELANAPHRQNALPSVLI